ncbi:hypothetical protein TWF730_007090 [Orbilia blumenaviensis]|uniref:Uncharacterized protein n=1 Tax=Orbilia blumenaviensis TaxID=1796055 RepID=A0AAV9VG77_9PEZI
MKLLLLPTILLTATAAHAQTCFSVWQYVQCSSNGPSSVIASTAAGPGYGGGGSPSWCTAYCNTNAPSATYAGIITQQTNGQYTSYCRCGVLSPNSPPIVPDGAACYYPCAYSSKTEAMCRDGTCRCGGPRAYSIYTKVTVCP